MPEPDKPLAEALASDALDPKKMEDVERAISKLTPEEAQHFVGILERAIRRRRIQLLGYLVSMVVLLVGMVLALAYVGAAEPGAFVMWAFLVPFLAVGVVFWLFGRWASRVR